MCFLRNNPVGAETIVAGARASRRFQPGLFSKPRFSLENGLSRLLPTDIVNAGQLKPGSCRDRIRMEGSIPQ